MSKVKYFIIFIFSVFFSFSVCGQKTLNMSGNSSKSDNEGEHGHGHEHNKDEDAKESRIRVWKINGNGALTDSTHLDTLQNYQHIYHPVFKDAVSATYLGNYGCPGMNNDFFKRGNRTNYFFLQSRQDYILTPGKIEYLNTTTPYTRLDYSQSEKKSSNNETRLNVIHSRNINPFWNFTFRTNQEKSDGQYSSQDARDNFVALTTSYSRDNWNVYGGFISNTLKNNENGGLTADSVIHNGEDPEYWNVNLSECKTKISALSLYGTAEYRMGRYDFNPADSTDVFRPIMGLIYSMEYDGYNHRFQDEEDTSNKFFDNTYYEDTYTIDEIEYRKISNVFQIKQYENPNRKYTFGKRVFIGHELYRGSMPGDMEKNDYPMPYPFVLGAEPSNWGDDSTMVIRDIKYGNVFIGGGIFRENGKFWTWNFDGKLFLTGRNAGQFELNGFIAKPFRFWDDSTAYFSFAGKIENSVPDYFQENFSSNHYRWYQDLDSEQRITLGATLRAPGRNFEVSAKYSIINNFLYNNDKAIPDQAESELLVMSLYADKDFSLRNFHIRPKVLWQKVSNDKYLKLPELSAFLSLYYRFIWSKVMYTQIGADVRYNTKYYADAYAPSTGLFYLQNKTKYGEIPYLDFYASLKLKRTIVFFKWYDVGFGSLFKVDLDWFDEDYMTVAHYPMPRTTFRLGVTWSFYD